MKLFVVKSGNDIFQIFSSEEKANEYIKFEKENCGYNDYWIDEGWELDPTIQSFIDERKRQKDEAEAKQKLAKEFSDKYPGLLFAPTGSVIRCINTTVSQTIDYFIKDNFFRFANWSAGANWKQISHEDADKILSKWSKIDTFK